MAKKKKEPKKSKLLFSSNDWTFETIQQVFAEIEKISKEELGLDTFPMQIEVISADQMLDAYSSVGLPIYYQHWSLGKRHLYDEANYKKGRSALAYEIVVNTSPTIAYLMENNTMTMQTLVLSHVMGHAHFFKHNYLYKQWTHPEFIVDYLKFAKNYIQQCEERYGMEAVEKTLDAAHALKYNSVDKYKRKNRTKKEMKEQLEARVRYEESNYDTLWSAIGKRKKEEKRPVNDIERLNKEYKKKILPQPEENLLYFLEKNSPVLHPWQREILRIVRKLAAYFYPQMQSQIMNEGFACFSHYYIMNRLYEKGMITEGSMLEFLTSHTSVVYQTTPDFRSTSEKRQPDAKPKHPYGGFNPYAIGFAMMQDIKRICENPTEEDKQWFPDIAGRNWRDVIVDEIVPNYRDESFIRQFMSPKVMRDFRLFAIRNHEEDTDNYHVIDTHNESGYKTVRKVISDMNDINAKVPNIQIADVDFMETKKLTMHHYATNNQVLGDDTLDLLIYIKELWGYDVELFSIDAEGEVMESFDTGAIG